MMVRVYLFIFILFINSPAVSDTYMIFLNQGDTSYIMENSANFRDLPNLQSSIKKNVLAGSKVIILERLSSDQEIYGIKSPWYKIEYENTEYYIWGGLLSTEAFFGDINGDGSEELLLSRMETNQKDDYSRTPPAFMVKYSYTYRLIINKKVFSTNPIPDTKKAYNGISLVKDIGLKPNIAFLELSYSFGDGNFGYTNTFLYYWNGFNFVNFINYEYSDSFDETTRKETIYKTKIVGPKDNGLVNIIHFINYKTEILNETEETLIISIDSYKLDEKTNRVIYIGNEKK
jgi:hypothetical protein